MNIINRFRGFTQLVLTLILVFVFAGCNQLGDLQSPLKWEIESNNSSDIVAKINKKDVNLNVKGDGTVIFKCKNKKEHIVSCSVSINGETVQPASEYYNKEFNEFNNSFLSVLVSRGEGTVTMSFKDLPQTNTSVMIYVHSGEVGTPFIVAIKTQ